MAQKSSVLSTREFSDMTGISISSVTRLVREGKIKGVKKSGKWLIDKGELNAETVKSLSKTTRPPEDPGAGGRVPRTPTALGMKKNQHPSKSSARTYSVAEFSDLTYLTEKGVEEFLKSGRLQGARDDKGNWRVDHENLKNSNIRHLIR